MRKFVLGVSGGALAMACVGTLVVTLHPSASSAADNPCQLPSHVLTPKTLAEGKSATNCKAVGRYVNLGDATLPVPAAGMSVSIQMEFPTGAETYTISSKSGSGRIDYNHIGPDADAQADGYRSAPPARPAAAATTSLSKGGCDRSTYKLEGFTWTTAWKFYIGDGVQPAGGTQTDTANAAKRAAANITGSHNACGYTDQVSATSSYGGFTTKESNFVIKGGASACGPRDGVSEVDAGNIDGSGHPAVAETCYWTSSGRAVEADVRLNTTNYNFTYSPSSSSCRNKYDVESVMTHEFGHVYGLGDLSNEISLDSHDPDRYLTMYGAFPCRYGARTLGKGDVLGLRALY